MKILTSYWVIGVVFLLISGSALAARDEDHQTRTFPAKRLVRLETSMGTCVIKTGTTNEIKVELDYSVDFSGGGYYQPEMEEEGDELVLGERMKCRHCRGEVTWTLTVPEKTEVRFETASGDLEATGTASRIVAGIASGSVSLTDCKGPIHVKTASGRFDIRNYSGELSASTASGDIDIRACEGDIEVSTASGNIKAADLSGDLALTTASGSVRADNLKGKMKLSTASGNVRASGISVEGISSFSSASGDAIVSLASSPASDIEVGSASGDAVLRFNGNPIRGHIELIALTDEGDISAPFKFDDEREFRRHGQYYIGKSATVGTGGPEITIKTGSGEAALEK